MFRNTKNINKHKKCIYFFLVLKGIDYLSIQFTSGEFFNMKVEKEWGSFQISFSTFNIGSWNGGSVLIGQARQEEECTDNNCTKIMVSDKSVSIYDKVRFPT